MPRAYEFERRLHAEKVINEPLQVNVHDSRLQAKLLSVHLETLKRQNGRKEQAW